jgi:hypothetical protein
MEYELSMSQGFPPPYELDLLGRQLTICQRFAALGFPKKELFFCSVQDKDVPGEELFFERRGRWFLCFDSLPGTVVIKAIGADKRNLYVETAAIDFDEARDVLENVDDYMINQQGIFPSGKKDPLIKFSLPNAKLLKRGIRDRCLWTIPWLKNDAEGRELRIEIADRVYSANAFVDEEARTPTPASDVPPERPAASRAAPAAPPKIELKLSIEQQLRQEQIPLLADELRMEQRLAICMHWDRILREASEDELKELVAKDPSPAAQQQLVNLIVFTLAGKLKRAWNHPDLPEPSWNEARAMIRRKINRRQ